MAAPDNGERKGVHREESLIVVSDADMDRLSRLVIALKHFLFRDQLQLESLNQTLESAEVASAERIPRDIRMNSRIHLLDLDTGKKSCTITLQT